MKSRTLHNTISQNLITLIKVGAFGASSNDCLMLMSPYKWEKLLLAAEQIKVLPLIAKGTEGLKEDIHLPNFIYELLESKKDIIKIDADIPVNIDVIGFIDPGATVNIIRDGVRSDKMNIQMPAILTNVIRCKNPRCITTTEQELDHVFRLTDKENKVYRCVYCETKAEIERS